MGQLPVFTDAERVGGVLAHRIANRPKGSKVPSPVDANWAK